MSNTDKPSSEKEDGNKDKKKDSQKNLPDKKAVSLLEQMEVFAMQHKGGSNLIDFSRLSSEQIDALLSLMKQNEQNLSDFHNNRIEGEKEVKLQQISASTTDKRTIRYLALGGLTAFVIITLLILFYKDDYFSEWLAFLSGLGVGGLGGGLGIYFLTNGGKPSFSNSSDENEK